MPCWEGYERVPGTKAYTKGSCRKKSRKSSSRRRTTSNRRKTKKTKKTTRTARRTKRTRSSSRRRPRRTRRTRRKKSSVRAGGRARSRRVRKKSRSRRRKKSSSRSRKKKKTRSRSRSCSPGRTKKFAKMVNGKCVRYGDPNMTIGVHDPARRRSFCSRHRCSQKSDPQTPGYQSCKKWRCKTRR